MEKKHSSLLLSLFPWRSPFVIRFAIAKGGIEVQLFRNERRITRWHAAKLRRVLPESLVKWIDENKFATGPRPHPLARQLWQYLSPLASQKLFIDVSELAALQEVSQPAHFALIWEIDQVHARVQGKYHGADNYLGLGWFQTGNMIWPLHKPLPQDIATRFEQLIAQDLIISLPEAEAFLNTTLPVLQRYFPTHADFRLVTDFAVNIIVQNTQSGELTLALESNYPQLLSTLSIPQDVADLFLAQQALIRFPRQALTPVLTHLLQGRGTPVSLQGEDIPLFIREQLPVMRHYYQISHAMEQKIIQAYPIVSIATLQASFTSPVHTMENGIGKYSIAAIYQYQQHILNMHMLLDAYWHRQRFINQHGVWFEWSTDAQRRAESIRQSLVPRVLPPAEVMGLHTRPLAQRQYESPAYAIQPEGINPLERVQSLFSQLQYHGVPGGIVGDPVKQVNILLSICENLVRDDPQAHILWLTTSNKKGAVRRAVNGSIIQRYVTVASHVDLRDNASLFFQSWTLTIFYGLDLLCQEGSPEVPRFPQLRWRQAFLTIYGRHRFNPFMMKILHLPEIYGPQFCDRYLFDPEQNYVRPPAQQGVAGQRPGLMAAQPSGVKPTAGGPTAARPSEVKPASVTPPVQVKKDTAARPIEPAAPVASHFSTHKIPVRGQTTPLSPTRPKFVPSTSLSFWEQAHQWQDITYERVPLEKFEHYAPTYLHMQKPGILNFYLYWRSEVRNNRYPVTDIGYILVHVYETIACIGFTSPAAALSRLIDLWAYYRGHFPVLDTLLIPWIADFCVVYSSVSYRVMDWYTRLLTIPDYAGEADLLAEAWLRQGGDWAQMPSAVLYALLKWQPSLLLNLKDRDQHTLYERYHRALTAIDRYLREEKSISGLVGRYGQGQSIAVKRLPFHGALVARRHEPVTIEKVNVAFTSIEFRQTVIAILRYTDYFSQQTQQVKAALPPGQTGTEIDKNWQKAIKAALTTAPSAQTSQHVDQEAQQAAYTTFVQTLPTQIQRKQQEAQQAARTTLVQTLHAQIQRKQEAELAQQPLTVQASTQPQTSSAPAPRLTSQPVAERGPKFGLPSVQPEKLVPAQVAPERPEIKPAASAERPAIELSQTKIARLHEESEHLQERLTVETTDPSLPAFQVSLPPDFQPVQATKTEPDPPAVVRRQERIEEVHQEPVAVPRAEAPEPAKVQINEKDNRANTLTQTGQPEQKTAQITPADPTSLITQRVAVMKRYWRAFDEIHSRQAEGMPPLRDGQILNPLSAGFEHGYRFDRTDPLPRYQQLLPAKLRTDIEQLWGTVMLSKWPEHVVSEPFPHKLFAETFGIVLNFWHSCSLNVWFFCEYPLAFSDLSELAEFYRETMQELKYMGTPINRSFFEDLSAAGKQLGQPQSLPTTRAAHRKGFDKVRDVISEYRRQWAATYLDKYLQKRWEAEIHEASLSYTFSTSDKGIPPTAKQFAKKAKNATNHWFGGDMSRLYTMIGQPSPLKMQYVATAPFNRDAFAEAFAKEVHALKGQKLEQFGGGTLYYLNKLAEYSFRYLQLEEILGSPPELKHFNIDNFAKYSSVFSKNVDEAWNVFSKIIRMAEQMTQTIPSMGKPASAPLARSITQDGPRDYSRLEEEFARLRLDPASLPPLRRPERKSNGKSQQKIARENSRQAAAASPATQQPVSLTPAKVSLPPQRAAEQVSPVREIVPSPHTPVQLDQQAISKLQEESEYLQERLAVEKTGTLESLEARAEAMEQEAADTVPESATAVPGSNSAGWLAPEVDEDWQMIYPQWRSEHWDILRRLCQGRTIQFTIEERSRQRPISLLFDEINEPVDEYLNDLLIDADTQTLAPHLRPTVEHLVDWYYSLESR
ncbi:MAG TPA: TerB N-terminal domain-containing protein [Ktedonobacteraceae bacterium]|nr:TerB N-terminal domain-containing protein [Ktedonobacteraceae bacterium]